MKRIEAKVAPDMEAKVEEWAELIFEAAWPKEDLPAFLRGASGIRRWNGGFCIIQDDVHALGFMPDIDGAAQVEAILLPRGADGRRVFDDGLGNKELKMDLEACFVLPDGRFVAMGSGSEVAREVLILLDLDRRVQVVRARELYAQFHDRTDFSGSELNIEGAVVVGDKLRLFQRGNGAPKGDLQPVNSFADMELAQFLGWLEGGAVPELGRAVQVDLGSVGGVSYDFTDAALLPDGRVVVLAAAEDSPDTFADGENLGCVFGVVEGDQVRTTRIREGEGAFSKEKMEGIEFMGRSENGEVEFVVVVDGDDPSSPALLGRLVVEGL